MANGNTINSSWYAYETYSVGTNNDDTYSITVSLYVHFVRSQSSTQKLTVNGTVSATGISASTKSATISGAVGAGQNKLVMTKTCSWSKDTSAVAKTISFSVYGTGALGTGTSSGTDSATVPVKTSYNISYNANSPVSGQTVSNMPSPNPDKKYYGINKAISSTKPTTTGFTFSTWNTNTAGTGTSYASGATYSGNGALTLYAQWTRNSWNVTYNANGGQGAVATQSKLYNISLTLSNGAGFTRSLHTLESWNTKADGTGTRYELGDTYTSNAALTLYAQWHLDYVKPSIDLTSYRVDSGGNPTDDGEYIYLSLAWIEGYYNAYLNSTITVKIDNYQLTSFSTSTQTGTWSHIYSPYSKDTSHIVEVTIVDQYDSASDTVEIASAIYPIDLYGSGTDVYMGIMHPYQVGQTVTVPELYVGSADNTVANPDQNNIFIYFDDSAGSGVDHDLYVALDSLGWLSDVTS